MKSMAEVLADHEDCAFSASGILVCFCGVALEPQEVMDDMRNLAAHQADALTAAGFGPVKAAAAGALRDAADDMDGLERLSDIPEESCTDEENAAVEEYDNSTNPQEWLRARAAAIEAPDGP